MAERHVANVEVEGSIPFFRSRTCSSVGQSAVVTWRRSLVQAQPGPPALVAQFGRAGGSYPSRCRFESYRGYQAR